MMVGEPSKQGSLCLSGIATGNPEWAKASHVKEGIFPQRDCHGTGLWREELGARAQMGQPGQCGRVVVAGGLSTL